MYLTNNPTFILRSFHQSPAKKDHLQKKKHNHHCTIFSVLKAVQFLSSNNSHHSNMKSFLRIVSVLCSLQIVSAFVAPTNIAQVAPSIMTPTSTFSQLNMAPIDTDTLNTIVNNAPSMMLSETEPWVEPLSQILGPFFNIFSFFMVSAEMNDSY